MVPLVTATGISAGFNRATAGVVVGGQSLSLLLTLVAVPVVYSFFDDVSLWFRKATHARPADAAPTPDAVDAPVVEVAK
jgi:hypothetical protein